MIILDNIVIRNFLSVGQVTQVINLKDCGLTLILGENLDLGGNGNRNGSGKTLILQSIQFALYGTPISNIKLNNLINKTNDKNMFVSISFTKGNKQYKIERGRRPNFLKFYVDDGLVNDPDTDEAQGANKSTQREIERVLGISSILFKHIVSLNTYVEPFLAMSVGNQRSIIEELLGLTQLSEKAEILKDRIKDIKDRIKEEEFKITAFISSNKKIQSMINDLKLKSSLWERRHKKRINKLENELLNFEKIDINKELTLHELLTEYNSINSNIKRDERDKDGLEVTIAEAKTNYEKYLLDLENAKNHKCPTCNQYIKDDEHKSIIKNIELKIVNTDKIIKDQSKYLDVLSIDIEKNKNIMKLPKFIDKPSPYYSNISDAYNHKTTLEKIKLELKTEYNLENPSISNIQKLEEEGLKEIDYSEMNSLIKLKEHKDFLLKILTSKESFIRKKLIDQSLVLLNIKLKDYLEKINLPHTVSFQNDLSVEITELGRDLDFFNLSRGESNRLILALSWAFRDIWEGLNSSINLMLIDELVDSGMDTQGVDSSLKILKKMSRDKNKTIFLISHREELISRVNNTLLVTKENGFTSFTNDADFLP